MTIDITSLSIKVTSEGIKQAAIDLNSLSQAATNVEQKTSSVKSSINSLNSTQQASTSALEKALALMQKQVDLLGANTSETNAYKAAKLGANEIEKTLAQTLGAEVDAYKRLALAQAEANKYNAIQQKRDLELYNASVKEATQLQRQLALAQAEAIRMNNAFNAAQQRQKEILQNRDIERYKNSVREYTAAHAEAIKMNAEFDAALKRNRNNLVLNNEAMLEAKALARGLAGSLGALWTTYGNLTGLAVGLAIGSSLKNVVNQGKEVEHTLEAIRVRGQESVESINKVRDSILEIGKGVHGPLQVAEAFHTLVLAGLSANQALVSIHAALNLATVGGTSIEKAATTLVSIGTAIGFTAEGYSRVADVIAKTAALSISSVESLSEAFKSASSVNRLYGVSLVDISTSLGVLSNLGIQGSAAGTALKNFYKELSSEGEKVVKTLNIVGITPIKIKTETGDFKPLLEVVKELDAGLNKLSQSEQKTAIQRSSNERGLRLYTQALGLYREKLADGSNALQKFHDDAENSYGFAAIGAVQMALTAKSQLESMSNTLKTTFVEVFKSIEPEVILFSQQMKAAFGSQDFKNTIASISSAFARLALAISENLPFISGLVVGLVSLKTVLVAMSVAEAVAAGITALSLAFKALAAGTITLVTALPALAIVLATVGAAWTAYKLLKDDAQADKSAAVANSYANSYIEGLNKESERLELMTKKVKENMTAKQAAEAVDRDQAIQELDRLNKKAVDTARLEVLEKKRALILGGVNSNVLENLTKDSASTGLSQVDAYIKALEKEDTANRKLVDSRTQANQALKRLTESGKAHAIAVEAQAEAARKAEPSSPTATLGTKVDTKGINDRYSAQITAIRGQIEANKRELANTEALITSKFKSGLISELDEIDEISNARIKRFTEDAAKFQSIIDLAAPKNKLNVKALVNNDLVAAQDKAREEYNRKEEKTSIYFAKLQEDNTNNYIKELELRGRHEESAKLKSEKLYASKIANEESTAKRLTSELADTSPFDYKKVDLLEERIGSLKSHIASMKAESKALVDKGALDDAIHSFNKLQESVVNSVKGIQTANEGYGLATVLEASLDASNKLIGSMEELRKRRDAIGTLSIGFDSKALEEADAKLRQLGEDQRKLWEGVGESIAKSLKDAYGQAGQAAGDFLIAAIKSSQIQKTIEQDKQAEIKNVIKNQFVLNDAQGELNKISIAYAEKERSARIKSYGDMASAAKGFFKEGSAGYKLLENAEKAFRALELVEALKNFVIKSGLLTSYLAVKVGTDTAASASDSSYTLGAIANAALRATGDGIAAVAKAIASLPFPANLAAGAATAAALASFGVALFGGGSGGSSISPQQRQAATGTGSVLGDDSAKSQSIANSLHVIEKNSGLGLVHSSKMVDSLRTLVNNISGLASILVRNVDVSSGKVPGVTEGLSSVFSSIPVIGGFLSKLFGTTTTVKDQGITATVRSVGDIGKLGFNSQTYADIESASKFFGITVSKSATTQLLAISKEVDQQFGKVILNLASSVSSAADILGVGGDALTDKLKTFVVDIGLISTKGLSGEQIQKQLEAAFSKVGDDLAKFGVGGLEAYQKVGEGYLETLSRVANDFIQTNDIIAVLGKTSTEAFGAVGIASVGMRERLINGAGGLDKLTAGTKFLVDNLFTEEEKQASVAKSVKDELARLNLTQITTIDQYKKQALAALDGTTAGQDLYLALINLAPAFKQVADYNDAVANGTVALTSAQQRALDIQKKQRELDIQLLEAQGRTIEATAARRADELEALTKLSPALAVTQRKIYEVTDAAEFANSKRQIEIERLNVQGETYKVLVLNRQDELDALSKVNPALVIYKKALYDAADAAKSHSLDIQLIEALGGATIALNLKRQDELKTLSDSQKAIQLSIYAAQDRAKLATSDFNVLKSAVSDAKAASKNAFDAQIAVIKAQKSAAETSYNNFKTATEATLETSKKANKALEDLASSLSGTLDTLSEKFDLGKQRLSGQNEISKALDTAIKTGVLPTADSLKDSLKFVSRPSEQLFSNFNDYAIDFGITAGKIADLNKITGDAKKKSDTQLEVLQEQLDAAKAAYDLQVLNFDKQETAAQARFDSDNARLDMTLSYAQQQLDAMNGTQVAVLSVTSALAAFNSSVLAVITAQQAAGVTANTNTNAVNGQINTPQPATTSQITGLYKNILGREPDAAGLAFWQLQASKGASASSLAEAFYNSQEYKAAHGSHEAGIDYIPFDNYRANLHEGEAVLNARQAKAMREDTSNTEILEMLKMMKEDNSAENKAIIEWVRKQFKLFENSMPGGNYIQTVTITP